MTDVKLRTNKLDEAEVLVSRVAKHIRVLGTITNYRLNFRCDDKPYS